MTTKPQITTDTEFLSTQAEPVLFELLKLESPNLTQSSRKNTQAIYKELLNRNKLHKLSELQSQFGI